MTALLRFFRYINELHDYPTNPRYKKYKPFENLINRIFDWLEKRTILCEIIVGLSFISLKFIVTYFFIGIYVFIWCVYNPTKTNLFPDTSLWYTLTGQAQSEIALRKIFYFEPSNPEKGKIRAYTPFEMYAYVANANYHRLYKAGLWFYFFMVVRFAADSKYWNRLLIARNLNKGNFIHFLNEKYGFSILYRSNFSIKKESYMFTTISKFFKF